MNIYIDDDDDNHSNRYFKKQLSSATNIYTNANATNNNTMN